MIDELTQKIETLLMQRQPVVVGLSGFGGSGKTTLATKLRDHFKVTDAQVVHLDNLFAEDHGNKPLFEDYDWNTLSELLRNIQDTDRLVYIGRGFYGERVQFDEPMPPVVIVEGVRLFRPDVIGLFDLAVWIDIDPEVATQRGEARDRASGADADHVRRWRTEWLPKDQQYFDEYRPDQLATYKYSN